MAAQAGEQRFVVQATRFQAVRRGLPVGRPTHAASFKDAPRPCGTPERQDRTPVPIRRRVTGARARQGGATQIKGEDEPDLAQTIQSQLLNTALERGVFRFEKEQQRHWDRRAVTSGIEYGVFVPMELEAHVG